MINYARYIGIPFVRGGRDVSTGLDCWGLVIHFYENELGINLPTYSSITTVNKDYQNASEQLQTSDIYRNLKLVDESKPTDLLLFRVGNYPLHIGIAVDNMRMLHAHDRAGSVIERFDTDTWKTKLHSIHRLK